MALGKGKRNERAHFFSAIRKLQVENVFALVFKLQILKLSLLKGISLSLFENNRS